MKRIALFTDFSPRIGGGSAILRSLLPAFEQASVKWLYRADHDALFPGTQRIAVPPGTPNLAQDLLDFTRLWLGLRQKELEGLAEIVLEEKADAYWVVAHGLGIALGNVLRALCPEVPLHVSVHDDPERGVFGRSRRYRLLARMVRRSFRQLLASAESVDVTSVGMNQYYERLWGIQSVVVYPYVPKLPCVPAFTPRDRELRIGHVGSIYSFGQFVRFLRGVCLFCSQNGYKPVVVLIGQPPRPEREFVRVLPAGASIRLLGEMREVDAVAELSSCNFLYAAYPANGSARVFRQTSFPTKLSTYVQAQRPIFAHTPRDSTLARAVSEFGVGVLSTSELPAKIATDIKRLLASTVSRDTFENFRTRIYGPSNVLRLEEQLLSETSART